MSCVSDEKATPAVQRMCLRYGFNEIDAWQHIALGKHREEIRRRHRLMGTQIVRIFVFDKPVPNPVSEWHNFAAYVQAVLDMGALPMITFAKYHPPHDDPRAMATYVARCADVVWGCLQQWGGDAVRDWYWCIWNEPNNFQVGGKLSFAQYRRIYEAVAERVLRLLEPHLAGRNARIGGPAACGFQPYWLDYISGVINEIDEALVSFVSWHHYGDWRPVVPSETLGFDIKGDPEAPAGHPYERLLMAQTPQYEARARAVARVIGGRNIQNFCGELNTLVNHDFRFTGGLNHNTFGAAYYASALIHLIRGGADLEMRWTATADDAYGLMNGEGKPTAACLAKQIFAQHVRFGDSVRMPERRQDAYGIDAIIAASGNRRSCVFVNTSAEPVSLAVSDWDAESSEYEEILKIDATTGERVQRASFDGSVHLHGYGLAVVSNAAAETIID